MVMEKVYSPDGEYKIRFGGKIEAMRWIRTSTNRRVSLPEAHNIANGLGGYPSPLVNCPVFGKAVELPCRIVEY